ncbi:cytochrome P450 [Rhizophagus clarus]|uniref:Cytochrome P450 n=1 Tax=Rhizophagus clarus TaxID=94130 RepID=A0A8H3R2W5_9GLOM|nr:cytochrome P450 [Rhizophagus clarus]
MATLIFLTIIFAIIIYYVKANKKPSEIDKIPRASALSTMWLMLRNRPQDEIQDAIRESAKGHDIYLSKIGPIASVNILSAEYAKDILTKSEDLAPKLEYEPGFVYYDFFGRGLIFSNGDLWRTYRKLANTAFNSALSPEMVGETVLELFSYTQRNLDLPIDIYETMQRTTIEILGKLAFGYKFGYLKSNKTPHIITVYKFIMSIVKSPYRFIFPWINKLPTANNKKFYQSIEEFDKFIFDIVETKRSEIKNKPISDDEHVDLLTSMLRLSEQEKIHADTKQLRDEMVNFFVAGHDTTSMSLSTTFYYLAKYPEIQERARAEVINVLGNELTIPTSEQLKKMEYINAILKESLRIYPPGSVISLRSLKEPIKIGPYVVPKDVLCLINLWQIHYDPKYWENPKQYDPDRFLSNEKRHPFSWIPFSSGPRNCVGQNFALMEQRVILSMMLHKYSWTLPKYTINKEKLILESQFFLKPVDVKLIFTKRTEKLSLIR